ncbi:MAG: 5'-3'-deoxyribonucleotidase [Verrucomicrobia bacterium]|nr:5'-3'-deoxyribonucleotidase [Verrucomicrobiota bacterium]MBV8484448.1 5'-3'-deoxyribonucleotidase [Verrucomicrobiota bacterium]
MDRDRKSRITIAVDLDEVTADTVSKRLVRYRADYGVELSQEEIRGKQIRDAVPLERKEAVEACLDEPGFSRDIPVMPDAQRVLQSLSTRFDIFVATSAMDHPVSLYDRYLWLQEYLPFLTDRSYVFCGSKRILKADFLIDDNPRNLEMFSGTGILFTAHHNIYERRFTRVNDWEEVAAYFERVR